MFGQNNPELAVRKVDRHFLERSNGVHSEQQRRFAVKAELLERMSVRENHREIGKPYPANRQLSDEHIVAVDLRAHHGLKLHALVDIDEVIPQQPTAQSLVADADL